MHTARLLLLTMIAAAAACAAQDPPPSLGPGPIVAISRDVDASTLSARRDALARRGVLAPATGPDDFFLAVRRDALEQDWFMSVFLKQVAPDGGFLHPFPLGTRVVRFHVQNGKLYVFDVARGRATSALFDPTLILDAYPIVDAARSDGRGGDYVIVDPAGGLNRFSALSDVAASGSKPVRLATELSYVQAFRGFSDGASYEQILTTYTDTAIGVPSDTEPNEFRLVATLGVSFRAYREDPAYHPVATPDRHHFFLTDPVNVLDAGTTTSTPVHWALAPGRAPIRWLLSPRLVELTADPRYKGVDLVGAAKRGVESWNDVLGFRAFTAEVDPGGTSFAEDRVNYVAVDTDPNVGRAFATYRANPNTGEIRSGFVYVSAAFLVPQVDDPPPPPAPASSPAPQATGRRLIWLDRAEPTPCAMPVAPRAPTSEAAAPRLSAAEKLERTLTHVIAHEVGHTLGLRHNFKGSLLPPSSSIMEYSVDSAVFAAPTPGPYDRDAVRYLSGQSTQLPAQPFGTDEDQATDPDTVPFDAPSPRPLVDFQIPRWSNAVAVMQARAFPTPLVDLVVTEFAPNLLGYVRAGAPADAAAAWTTALDGLRTPPASGARATSDALVAAMFRELYLAPHGELQRAPADPDVVAAIASDAEQALIDADGWRSDATRRLIVDALKQAQHPRALLALTHARTAIAAAAERLPPDQRVLADDLLARIDQALHPYFR